MASAITLTSVILPVEKFLLLKYPRVNPGFPISWHLLSLPLPWLPYMKFFHYPVLLLFFHSVLLSLTPETTSIAYLIIGF